MCYQRPNHNSNSNHGNEKPTHIPHSSFGHKWTEPYFDLQMPRNVTSLVGKSAYLGCRVRNLGNKTVAWIRHRDLHILTVGTYTYTTDQRFQTSFHRDIDEWTLQIKWAQKRDAGAYECQISTQPVRAFSVNLNIVDSIYSDTDNLLQHYYSDDEFIIDSNRLLQRGEDEFAGLFPMRPIAVPTATILGGPDLYVDKGSTINLTCAIKFSPEPPTHIFWYHQDKVLSEDSERGGISFVASKEDSSKSILLIENADLPDSGKYSCYPSNTEIASIRVHVLNGERPEAMQTSGASRLKFIGYHSSLFKITPAITVTTAIPTILITIYSTTTLMHILMMTILMKFCKKFLYYLNNWSIINTTSESSEAVTVKSIKILASSSSVTTTTVTTFTDNKKINEKNLLDNIISYPTNCSDNFIITEPKELVYDTHHDSAVININKSTIKLYNKFKECYRKVYHLDYHLQHQHQHQQYHHQQNHYQHQYKNNNQHHCQYQEQQHHQYIMNNMKKNQRILLLQQQQQQISNEILIHSYCSCCCFSYCNENIVRNCNCFNVICNNNNTNIIDIYCIIHQQQLKNNSCEKKIDDFRKILTTNFSQLKKNYLLKSSSFYNKLNIKNYHQNEINCHYHCLCNCSFNEKNHLQYRQQVSSRYLER